MNNKTVKQSVTMVASLFYYELLISAVTSPLNTISSFSLYVESDTVTSPFSFFMDFLFVISAITYNVLPGYTGLINLTLFICVPATTSSPYLPSSTHNLNGSVAKLNL